MVALTSWRRIRSGRCTLAHPAKKGCKLVWVRRAAKLSFTNSTLCSKEGNDDNNKDSPSLKISLTYDDLTQLGFMHKTYTQEKSKTLCIVELSLPWVFLLGSTCPVASYSLGRCRRSPIHWTRNNYQCGELCPSHVCVVSREPHVEHSILR